MHISRGDAFAAHAEEDALVREEKAKKNNLSLLDFMSSQLDFLSPDVIYRAKSLLETVSRQPNLMSADLDNSIVFIYYDTAPDGRDLMKRDMLTLRITENDISFSQKTYNVQDKNVNYYINRFVDGLG